jgi:hypothetical protein
MNIPISALQSTRHGVTSIGERGVTLRPRVVRASRLRLLGFQTRGSRWLRITLAVGAPLLAAVVWILFGAPGAQFELHDPLHLVLEVLFFGGAVLALLAAGRGTSALVFGALAVGIGSRRSRRWSACSTVSLRLSRSPAQATQPVATSTMLFHEATRLVANIEQVLPCLRDSTEPSSQPPAWDRVWSRAVP